jgi:hypothetical protein
LVDIVWLIAPRWQDWHFCLHFPSFHSQDKRPMEHRRYILLLAVLCYSELQGHGNEHIDDWYFLDWPDWWW